MDNRTANLLSFLSGLQHCSKVRENFLLNLNVAKTTNHFLAPLFDFKKSKT